jgi:hypothetical protein
VFESLINFILHLASFVQKKTRLVFLKIVEPSEGPLYSIVIHRRVALSPLLLSLDT